MKNTVNIFGIQRQRFRSVFIVLIVVAVTTILYFFLKESSFIKSFEKETTYSPKIELGKGYTGKVNKILQIALKDTLSNQSLLNDKYNRLNFHIEYILNEASGDSIIDWNRTRLIGFIPNGNDEKEFYYNSHLYDDIFKQARDLNNPIFKIETKDNSITRIMIDKSLHNSNLDSYFWEGDLVLNNHNIYENALVLKYRNREFYLKESDSTPNRSPGSYIDIRLKKFDSLYFKTPETTMQNLKSYVSKNTIRIVEEDINVMNVKYGNNEIFYTLNNPEYEGAVFINGTPLLFENRIKKREDSDFPHIININNEYEIIVSRNTLGNIGSKMVNTNKGLKRDFLNINESELFLQNMTKELSIYQDKLKYATLKDSSIINKNINLSIKKDLNLVLNNYLKSFLNERIQTEIDNSEYIAGITLMNPNTGEILAVADYDSRRKENETSTNINFTTHKIGSTFKPILGVSAIAKYPRLIDYQLNFDGNNTSRLNDFVSLKENKEAEINLLGYSMATIQKSSVQNLPLNQHRFEDFFRYSLNVYPNALLLLSMSEPGNSNNITENHLSRIHNRLTNGNVNIRNLRLGDTITHTSRLSYYDDELVINSGLQIKSYHEIFDVDYEGLKNLKYTSNRDSTNVVWDDLINPNVNDSIYRYHLNNYSPYNHSMRIDDMMRVDKGKKYRSHLASWVLGAGSNYWSNIRLAEAYSRILSRKRIRANFMKQKDTYIADSTDLLTDWIDSYDSNHQIIENKESLDNAWDRLVLYLENTRTAREAINIINQRTNANNERTLYDELRDVEIDSLQLRLLCKTGTPFVDKPKEIINTLKNGREKKTYITTSEGLFAFALVENSQFENLQELNDYNTDNDIGIVGVIYIRKDTEAENPEASEVNKVSSSAAVDLFSNRDFLSTIIVMNKELFNR